jgi:hypothetical protein
MRSRTTPRTGNISERLLKGGWRRPPCSPDPDMTDASYHTCAEVEQNLPIRQGDIFLFRERLLPECPCVAGVVVTPNCDFAQLKHVGNINVVPIVDINHYIRSIHVLRTFGDFGFNELPLDVATSQLVEMKGPVVALLQDIGERLRKLQPSGGGTALDPTVGAILDIANADIRELQQMFHAELGDLEKLHKRLGALIAVEEFHAGRRSAFDLYAAMRQAKSEDASFEGLRKKVAKDLMASIPKDIYFIDGIPSLEITPRFALLRFMQNVPMKTLTCSMSEYRYKPNMGVRVARMDTRHLACLTLQLATLYAEMGAPPEYESARLTALKALA